MSDCTYLAKCPVFARFKNEGASHVWVALYCRNESSACERLKLHRTGARVPDTLLPDGTHLAEGNRSVPSRGC